MNEHHHIPQFVTVPAMAAFWNLSRCAVEEAIARTGVRPAYAQNGTEYYDDNAIMRIHCYLADSGAIENEIIQMDATVEINDE